MNQIKGSEPQSTVYNARNKQTNKQKEGLIMIEEEEEAYMKSIYFIFLYFLLGNIR